MSDGWEPRPEGEDEMKFAGVRDGVTYNWCGSTCRSPHRVVSFTKAVEETDVDDW